MNHAHAPGGASVPVLVVVLAVGYDILASYGGRPWPWWRTMSFLTGCALLLAGLTPQVMPWPAGDFRGHVLQHLLVGMFAPIALVFGAPVTLLLRTPPASGARLLGRLLRRRPVRALAHPGTVLVLTVGGLALLYLSPLYAATTRDPNLLLATHVHFLLSGYLFAWVVAGPDPAPHRPPVPARLVILGVAIAVHAVLAQLIYAGVYVHLAVDTAQRQGGATLMYYGGDLAELILALAVVATWRPGRRSGAGTPPPGHRAARPRPAVVSPGLPGSSQVSARCSATCTDLRFGR